MRLPIPIRRRARRAPTPAPGDAAGWPEADAFAFVRGDDRFEGWLREPLPPVPEDPEFVVRRGVPADFDAIYDLVDEAFGQRRPRAQYDWLYRRNPGGLARCWLMLERESGRLVSSLCEFPWPLAHGSRIEYGSLGGDNVVAPDWQRRGIQQRRRRISRSHPDFAAQLHFDWPNAKTRGRQHKTGEGRRLLGPLPRAELRLERPRAGALSRRMPRWRRPPPTEEVRRFDAAFDPVTWRWMGWDGIWSPHDAAFLNWRYFDHPTRTYRAFALQGERDAPRGYCVVALDGASVHLLELAAPREPAAFAALVGRAAEAAREAGARRLKFFAPPAWPGWPMLRASGFDDRPSERHLQVRPVDRHGPAYHDLASWQLVPGDDEVL